MHQVARGPELFGVDHKLVSTPLVGGVAERRAVELDHRAHPDPVKDQEHRAVLVASPRCGEGVGKRCGVKPRPVVPRGDEGGVAPAGVPVRVRQDPGTLEVSQDVPRHGGVEFPAGGHPGAQVL